MSKPVPKPPWLRRCRDLTRCLDLFIHLGVSRPGCLLAGLDLPWESRLLFHPRRSNAASDAAPAPSPISGWRILSVLQPGRKRSVSSGCGCPCLSAPVTQTWHWALQRPSASSSGGSAAPRRQTDRPTLKRWCEPQGTELLRRDRNMRVI